jgi:hypothetical protein
MKVTLMPDSHNGSDTNWFGHTHFVAVPTMHCINHTSDGACENIANDQLCTIFIHLRRSKMERQRAQEITQNLMLVAAFLSGAQM